MPTLTTSDLTSYLNNLGLTNLGSYDLDSALNSAILTAEGMTRRRFYLNDANTPQTVRYNPPKAIGRDLLLEIFDTFDITAIYSSWNGTTGTALVEGTNYELLPENTTVKGISVEAIQFLSWPSTSPRSIAVVGKLGLKTLPVDLKRGILALAAADVMTQAEGNAGTAIERKIGDRSVKYADGEMLSAIGKQKEAGCALITKYIKVPYV